MLLLWINTMRALHSSGGIHQNYYHCTAPATLRPVCATACCTALQPTAPWDPSKLSAALMDHRSSAYSVFWCNVEKRMIRSQQWISSCWNECQYIHWKQIAFPLISSFNGHISFTALCVKEWKCMIDSDIYPFGSDGWWYGDLVIVME